MNNYHKIMFAYYCYLKILIYEKSFAKSKTDKFAISKYGYAFRHGKFAVVYAASKDYKDYYQINDFSRLAKTAVDKVLID